MTHSRTALQQPIPWAPPKRRLRWLRGGLLATAAILALVFPTAAYAGTGAGDPSATGCDSRATSQHNNLTMVDPVNKAVAGTAYIVYSSWNGGCDTEWVTVHYNSGYRPSPSIWLQNQSGTDLYAAYTSGGLSYTYQLGSMRYRTGCGGVQLYRSDGSYVDWFYLGCY
ncbi:hypothetical protein ACFO0M_17605 [Micromonospora mangrovi]|uniref:Spore-associated protein A n=2 Tax=Micromonospora TaxID=1873 RepID=A0AAU7MDJ9_9ACTN